MNTLIIILAKIVSWGIKTFLKRAGSTWPGHIAYNLNTQIIGDILNNNSTQIFFIVGTNGKTTTAKMLRHILEKDRKKIFQNEEGANLLNGITGSIIRHVSITGRLDYDVAIFEVDENTLPPLLDQVQPDGLVVLNLFRDQLDRYGEVNIIARNWMQAFKKLTKQTHLLINGDDPQLYFLGKNTNATVHYYGLSEKFMKKKDIPHDVDSVYCPRCDKKLKYKTMSYSHLGDFSCPQGDFTRENVETFDQIEIMYPLLGMYNVYNTHAVLLTVREVCNIQTDKAVNLMKDVKAAYGRQERFIYKKREIIILLSKNPTGFNQSIELVRDHFKEKEVNVLVILNDRIPDGRDISWIWDVEYERLVPYVKKMIISGDRTYDMAIRIKNTFEAEPNVTEFDSGYSFAHVTVQDNLAKAIETAVTQTEEGANLVILPTYSAMLETREMLLGRKIM